MLEDSGEKSDDDDEEVEGSNCDKMESHVFLVTTTLEEIKAQSLSEVSTRTGKIGENLPSQRFRMIQSKFFQRCDKLNEHLIN